MTNVYVLLRLFLSSFTSFAVSRSLCLLMQSLLLLPQCAELCTFVQLLLADGVICLLCALHTFILLQLGTYVVLVPVYLTCILFCDICPQNVV